MTDLINKTPEEIKEINDKFTSIYELIKHKENYQILSLIFDTSVNYLNNKYSGIEIETRQLCMVFIRKIFDVRNLNRTALPNTREIHMIIDEFITYHKDMFNTFIEDTKQGNNKFKFIDHYINIKKSA